MEKFTKIVVGPPSMRLLGLVLEVDGDGGDKEQLMDPGLDGGVGLRTDKAELKIIAGFLPIVGLVCSFVVVWNSAADHLYTHQWKQ